MKILHMERSYSVEKTIGRNKKSWFGLLCKTVAK